MPQSSADISPGPVDDAIAHDHHPKGSACVWSHFFRVAAHDMFQRLPLYIQYKHSHVIATTGKSVPWSTVTSFVPVLEDTVRIYAIK